MTITLTAAVSGAPRVEVTAPTLKPLKYGLLSVANVAGFGDPHAGFGFEYEAQACGTVNQYLGSCDTTWRVAAGTASISVGTTRNATLTVAGGPPSDAVPAFINWGDGTALDRDTTAPVSGTHTYAANGTYTVTVTGDNGYSVTITGVTVTNGSASGPFTGNATSPSVKTDQDGVPWVTGEPFVLYALQKCRSVYGLANAENRVRALFNAGEPRGAEKAFAALLDASTASSNVGGGTLLDPVLALSKVETHARDVYGGAATIHMSPQQALVLGKYGLVEPNGDHLETALGTPVAVYKEVGAVVPQGQTAITNADWIWATGSVTLQQGAITVVSTAPNLQNEFRAIAERPYAASWECFAVGAPADNTKV